MAKQCIIIVDQSKIVSELGTTFPVTVSVLIHFLLNSVFVPGILLHILFGYAINFMLIHKYFSVQVEVLPPAILPVLRQLVALGGGDLFTI